MCRAPRLLPFVIIMMLFAHPAHVRAQDVTRDSTAIHAQDALRDSTAIQMPQRIDSLATESAIATDSLTTKSTITPADTTAFVMAKSPLGAVLRSAIIPGWGQLYNESYWKVPVVLGLSAFLIYGIISENNTFMEYADRYDATITVDRPAGNLQLKLFREFYRDRRDTYAWWFVVTYLVQIADAFVDAHLYDFDVSSEMRLMLGPTRVGVQLRW